MRRAVLALALVCGSACADPMRERSLASLGDELPGVPRGPSHRPGQPCLVCHGGQGPAEGVFAFAGTLYQRRSDAAPLHDARVRAIDASGAQYDVVSNCAGNFWVRAANFEPRWPLWMKVELGAESVEMRSPSFREGSCGACHEDPATPSSVGHVYFADDDSGFSQEPCR